LALAESLLLILKLAVSGLLIAVGAGASFSDVLYLWRRPGLLVRSLLAMYVLVPLAAVGLAKAIPLSPGVELVFLVIAVSAGAPLIPRRLRFEAGTYLVSLVITSSIISIVMVPAWLAMLSHMLGTTEAFPFRSAAIVMTKSFLVPVVLGMCLGRVLQVIAPHFRSQIVDVLFALSAFLFLGALLMLVIGNWQVFLEVRGPGIAAVFLLMLIAMVTGHLLGGPDPAHQTALSIACCTRHLGIATIVAETFRGPRAMVLLTAYLVASALVTIPYLRWRHQQAASHHSRVSDAGYSQQRDGPR